MTGLEGPHHPDPGSAPRPPLPAGYGGPQGADGYGYRIGPPDLLTEAQNGDRARVALWAGAVASVLQIVCSIIVFASLSETFSKILDDAAAGRRTTTAPPVATDPLTITANLLSNVLALVLLIVGVVFLVWFHKALANARALGLPLTRSPGWGVAGFLIPIVNLWFPYQSMRDLFPATHPARSQVGRWWASYLGASFMGTAAFVASLVSPPVGWVIGFGTAALYVLAAITARDLIAASTAVHRDLAAALAAAVPAEAVGPLPGGPPPVGGGQPLGSPHAGLAPPAGGWVAEPPPPKDPWRRN